MSASLLAPTNTESELHRLLEHARDVSRLGDSSSEMARTAEDQLFRVLKVSNLSDISGVDTLRWIDMSLKGAPTCCIERPLTISTMRSRMKHLNAKCARAGLPRLFGPEAWRHFDAVAREYGVPPTPKRAATDPVMRTLLGPIDEARLRDVQLRAVALFGRATRQRGVEFLGLDCADIRDHELGVIVRFTFAKNHQDGEPDYIEIPYHEDPSLCPVRALRTWQQRGGITSGWVFRSFARGTGERITDRRLRTRTARQNLKDLAVRAGLDPAEFGLHSLRRGGITEAVLRGETPQELRRHSRHESDLGWMGYVDPAALRDYLYERGLSLGY